MSTLVLLDKGIYSQIWNCLKLGRLVDRTNEPVNEQCQIEPLTPYLGKQSTNGTSDRSGDLRS